MRQGQTSSLPAFRSALETVLALLALALLAAASGVFERFDYLLYDSALALRKRAAPADIAIVAIDERSLAELGRWPWSRRLHARLVDRLKEADAAVVAFDVLFTEPQAEEPGADEALAQAIRAHGRVVLPVYPQREGLGGRIREVPPMPQFRQAAAALGHVDVELDADAVARRVFLYGGEGVPRWPSLALAVQELAANGVPLPETASGGTGGRWMRNAELMVPFAGGAGHFRRISAVDLLRDAKAAGGLRGSLVLVGATATGLQRDFATPVSGFGQPLSGVELHANVVDSLRQGLGIRPLAWPWSIALTLVPLLLAVAAYARADARSAFLATALLLVVVAATPVVLLHVYQVWLPPTPALLAVLLAYPLYAWRRIERTAVSLAAEHQKGRATLHAIGDAVITADRDGTITFANPQAERISGLANAKMRGRPVLDALQFADPAERSRVAAALEHCTQNATPTALSGPLKLRSANGDQFDVRVAASPVRMPDGRLDGVVLALTDLTESVAMHQRIAHQATHDSLTGLPNRTLLIDRLEHAIASARRGGTQVAVLFLDLDEFKRINDGFGHPVGDELLREVAQRLLGGARANDTVARWGGDEFLIVAGDLAGDDAATAVARKLLERLTQPFNVLGNEIHIGGSVGISLFPRDGLEPQTLVQNADRAMYRAKRYGHNRWQFFSESINQRAYDRRETEAGLRHAIARNELELHFQPQIDLQQRGISGAEVLLRWRHPQAGLLLPDQLVSVAEECGLIHEIGAWVLRSACRRTAAWRDAGTPLVPLAVNVSPRQLLGQDLGALVSEILIETKLDPALLVLEITESAMMLDIERVLATLHEIRALGVRISIDDFGTGYSSLSLLRRLPVEQIKIDRTFVRDITQDASDAAITRGVLAMAKGMGVAVIAEGVETAAQFAFLRENGCDAAQGFFISPPLGEAQFVEALQALTGPEGVRRFDLLAPLTPDDRDAPPTRH